MGYFYPRSIDEALLHLGRTGGVVVAGCTDVYPALGNRPLREAVIDLSGIDEARGIAVTETEFRIGALTTWTEIARAALPPMFDGLRAAALQVGGIQIQNAGTVGGNLCNASPAADGVPPLLTLDAEVELRSAEAVRRMPLRDFILGNRRTARRPDELLTAVLVPRRTRPAASTFLKLGARKYLVISIAMVAVLVESDGDGRVAEAAVAVGACSAVARRLPALEAALRGRALGAGLGDAARPEHLAPLSPISDMRGSAEYRRDAALTLVRRALNEVGGKP